MKIYSFYSTTSVTIAIIILLAISNLAYCTEGITLKAGVDTFGNQSLSSASNIANSNINTSAIFSGEYSFDLNRNITCGLGAGVQLPRSPVGSAESFSFSPVYALLKIQTDDKQLPYFIGHLGYNIFSGNDQYKQNGSLTNGMYYGIGAGYNFNNNLHAEMLYTVNTGELNRLEYNSITCLYDLNNYHVASSGLNLSLGYNFSLMSGIYEWFFGKHVLNDKDVLAGLGGDIRQQLKTKYGYLQGSPEWDFIQEIRGKLGDVWSHMVKELGVGVIESFADQGTGAIGGGLRTLYDLYEKYKEADETMESIIKLLEEQDIKVIHLNGGVQGIVVYNKKTNVVEVEFFDKKGRQVVIKYTADEYGVVTAGTDSISLINNGTAVPAQ